jgi:hypothetical protein
MGVVDGDSNNSGFYDIQSRPEKLVRKTNQFSGLLDRVSVRDVTS